MEAGIVELLKGVPVAAVLFYFATKFREDSLAARKQYSELVDKTIDGFSKQSAEVTQVVASSVRVMERVENKLNEKS